jgi:hypothetical protein
MEKWPDVSKFKLSSVNYLINRSSSVIECIFVQSLMGELGAVCKWDDPIGLYIIWIHKICLDNLVYNSLTQLSYEVSLFQITVRHSKY